MQLMLVIAICLIASFILSEICYRLHYPRIIGQISVGILLSFPVFKNFLFGDTIPSEIEFLSELGIIFLLMLVGLEVNIGKLKKSIGDSLNVALFSIVISFLTGFFAMHFLGYNYIVSIIVGVALSLSAEGTTLNILIETATLNTRIGTMLLSVGMIDDLFGVLFLGSVLALINQSSINIALTPFLIFGFILLVFIIFKYIPKLILIIQKEHSKISLFSTVLIIGISISSISQLLGFGPMIGAFIAGIILRWAIKNEKIEEENVEELKVMTFSFIVPFFFINIGLHFDIYTIINSPFLTLMLIGIGTFGKIVGALLVSFFRNISRPQAMLLGWGLNSRGAIELVIIEIARSSGLISLDLYSSVVAMAVITTFVFPFILRYYLNKYPGIMDM